MSKSQFSVLYACSTENEFCFEKRDKLQRKEHCICKFDPKNVRVPQLDITLVLAIINICYMHGPRIPPGNPKWLQEIKEVRNFLVHHGDRSCLSKADFEDKWQLLETNSLSIARISADSYMLAVQNRILSCKNETNVRLRLKEVSYSRQGMIYFLLYSSKALVFNTNCVTTIHFLSHIIVLVMFFKTMKTCCNLF